jgi:hypothetical protein
MEVDLDSEPYSAYGNISADGVRKLLGAPPLDRLTTMIRETVQNSWDARIRNPESVPEYVVRVRELEPSQAQFLREIFFAKLPPDGEADRIRDSLANPLIVEISDFGTVGLNGPTQPSEAVDEGEPTNFVDFLRNVGTPRNEHLGGGTYGFGKSSLFMLSAISTVIVDSETAFQGRAVRRVMGCRIGSNYASRRKRFTGRHWWGRRQDVGPMEPLTGRDASTARRRLGLPDRGPDQTGTTLAIIAPELPVDIDNVGAMIVRTLLVNFWPKLVPGRNGDCAMKFRVEVCGSQVSIPSPASTPPFNLFSRALKAARAPETSAGLTTTIRCERPKFNLGYLALEQGPVRPRESALIAGDGDDVDRGEGDPLGVPCRHVALMRPAELVVKYLPGPPSGDSGQEWAGVFIASDEGEVESAFAESEPPAHDDWNPDSIRSKTRRTLVRVALRRIRDEVASRFRQAPVVAASGGADTPLGATADRFGQALLSGGAGTGVSRVASSGRGSAGRSGGAGSPRSGTRLRIGTPAFVGLEVIGGIAVSVFSIVVDAPAGATRRIAASARLVMDGVPVDAADIPLGVTTPKVLAWRAEVGVRKGEQTVVGEGRSTWEVLVTCDGEHVTALTVEEVSGADR